MPRSPASRHRPVRSSTRRRHRTLSPDEPVGRSGTILVPSLWRVSPSPQYSFCSPFDCLILLSSMAPQSDGAHHVSSGTHLLWVDLWSSTAHVESCKPTSSLPFLPEVHGPRTHLTPNTSRRSSIPILALRLYCLSRKGRGPYSLMRRSFLTGSFLPVGVVPRPDPSRDKVPDKTPSVTSNPGTGP